MYQITYLCLWYHATEPVIVINRHSDMGQGWGFPSSKNKHQNKHAI